MKINKNHRDDFVIFVSFFILSFICLVIADMVGHNAAGAYIGPIAFEEIDWNFNGIKSFVSAAVATLALHKKDER